jgi:hypothetical protein
MAKARWAPGTDPGGEQSTLMDEAQMAEQPKMMEGLSLSGLFTIDLGKQTVRIATAVGATVANHPDNRVDFDLTAGTLTVPPGWRVINF